MGAPEGGTTAAVEAGVMGEAAGGTTAAGVTAAGTVGAAAVFAGVVADAAAVALSGAVEVESGIGGGGGGGGDRSSSEKDAGRVNTSERFGLKLTDAFDFVVPLAFDFA